MDATVSPSGSSTGTGMVLGTPGYMSPEQVRGDRVDARTDFFSLGAVLYEMLSGTRAFPTGPVVEAGYAILHNEPELLPSTVPGQVAQVVHRCLEKDAGRRFQSARDLAFNLELVRTPTPAKHPRWRRWFWLVAATLAMLGFAAMYLVERGRRLPTPSVERMTARRGAVTAARFGPDGRVVYSAAWGADPEQIFTQAPGSPETQTVGVPGARLLGVSAQGELAVSLRPVWMGPWGGGGTLALVPGVGGAPREVTENIVYADWSKTGELAVVRYVDGKRQLEYPLGTVLYESTGSIGFPRVSPKGDAVAFWSQPFDSAPNELLLVDRTGAIRHLVENGNMDGLAWAPNGDEVWYADGAALWASPLGGGRRLVYQGVSRIGLEDISRDGKVLVDLEDGWVELAFVPPGQERERALSWPNYNHLVDISDDGRQVLFSSFSGSNPVTYVGPTDGSSPLKLGLGGALAFSPDGKWVLVEGPQDPSVLSLLPIGVGVPKKLAMVGLNVGAARWLRDGKRLVVTAQHKGDKQWRLFVVPLEGGAPTPVADAPITQLFLEVSRDDRFAAVVGLDGILSVYPLDGSTPVALTELGKFSVPAGWTGNGQLWVSDRLRVSRDTASHLLRYDISSHRVVEERTFAPADPTGLFNSGFIRITPDSRAVAFDTFRLVGTLYLLDGLAPPRR